MGNNDSTPKELIPTVEESVVSPGSKPWVCKVDEHDEPQFPTLESVLEVTS